MSVPDVMFWSLSTNEQRLVRLMQSIRFGRIHYLRLHSGQPYFGARPTVIRTVKFRSAQSAMPQPTELATNDFPLRLEVVELFRQIRVAGSATIERLEVADGLPFLMELADPGTSSNPRFGH